MSMYIRNEKGVEYSIGASSRGFIAWEDMDELISNMRKGEEVYAPKPEPVKSGVPKFSNCKSFNPQLYVDDMIHLTSVDHACDIINDSRFWVVERWLSKTSLSHYKVDEFMQHMREYLKPWLERR